MKKKLNSMGRVAIALVLALSLSLVMTVPVSAQEAGTISLDTDWYGIGSVTGEPVGTTDGSGDLTGVSLANTPIVLGSVIMSDGTNTFTDDGAGVLTGDPDGTGTIDYNTGAVTITGGAAEADVTADYEYVTANRTVTITVEDADLNVPKAYPDEVANETPNGSITQFSIDGIPMSPWPANLVTVKDIAGTSYNVGSVNESAGTITVLTAPPTDATLMAAEAIALDLDLDSQPYKPTVLTVELDAAPGADGSVDVVIAGVIVITSESVGDTDEGGDFTGSLANTDVVAGSVSLTIGAETFTDDGEGILTGDAAGTGTIDYETGALTVTGAAATTAITADYDYEGSETVTIAGAAATTGTTNKVFRSVDTDGVDATQTTDITNEVVGTGDAAEVTFSTTLANPVVAGTVSVTDTVETFSDDGEGVLTGDAGGTGTIVYTTGALSVTFNTAPGAAQDVTADYTWYGSDSSTVTITATNCVYVTYSGAQENEATVNVKSSSDSTGFAVTLAETGVDTGVFDGDVALVTTESNATATPPELEVSHGDMVTATYTDESPTATVSATATLDALGPALSNESPVDGSFIDDSTPLFSVDVTDPDAGITYGDWTMNIESLGDVTAELSVSPITDGYRLEYLVSSGNALVEGTTYTWTVNATDSVGNQVTAQFTFTYDATAPELDAAVTGWTWDAEAETPAAVDTNSRTSIQATFSEDLDEATVEASDFLVADSETPSAVDVQGVNVFLTVTEMVTDATPSVELVGEVSDIAGNAQTEGLIEAAEDDIDPILSVAADPELGMDETEITITVTSSEALVADPTVNVTEADGAAVSVTMTGDTTTWEGTYTLDDANTAGVYAVTALGTDLAANDALGVTTISDELVGTGDATEVTFSTTLANTPIDVGTVSVTDATETFSDNGDGTLTGGAGGSGTINYNTGALSVTFSTAPAAAQDVTAGYDYFVGAVATFEGDFTTPTVTFTPADGIDVPTTSLWIAIDFDEDVEVLEATFDDVDVLAELYAVGEGLDQYMLARTDLAMEDHTISVLAVDLAGNEMTEAETATFTVVVPPPATIELFPGWNLISLPLIPDDSSIEAVLGEATVDVVWAYDPVNSPDDPWAKYVPGLIEDELTEMVDGMGYWIYMTSPATLTVPGVETLEPPALPPTYDVVSGWNLIGFKSIVPIDNDLYLANIDYTVLWGYETIDGYFSVHPMNEHGGVGDASIGDMEVGHGYWLWATIEGTIVLPQ